jgi:hypothetical protein
MLTVLSDQFGVQAPGPIQSGKSEYQHVIPLFRKLATDDSVSVLWPG